MNRIKTLREKKGINMTQAAKALQIPYTTYVNYEKGEREPNTEMLIKIAGFYGVSVDYLIGRSDRERPQLLPPVITDDVVAIPVIGEIAAGYGELAVEDWSGETVDIPRRFLKGYKSEEFFILNVHGDSMYPLYMEGDKVLILRQTALARSGEIGAVLYDSEMATLKKVEYVTGEDWMKLIPINPNYPPKTITGADLESCRIIGVPKLLIREIH